jgi:hypothetical protein
MCEYSSCEVYSQASISDTEGVDLNSCIGRSLKPYSYITGDLTGLVMSGSSILIVGAPDRVEAGAARP